MVREAEMRILILGAGATGGYFGGRLLQHGRDVSFLVHPRRAEALRRTGLVLHSPFGDVTLAVPPLLLQDELAGAYDLIVLSCKAYGLEQAMADIAPAVGPQTAILPLLNGMRHLDLLDQRFGAGHVLGGRCIIAATLDADGAVRHLNDKHALTFGERDGSTTPRLRAITAELDGAGFDAHASATIVQDMWDKWVMLASLAGVTCLFRAPVGTIVAIPGGREATLALLDECCAVAARAGRPVADHTRQTALAFLTGRGSDLTASMMRDLVGGHPIEAEQIIGDMLARAEPAGDAPPSVLALVAVCLRAYEAQRTAAH
jgi:2-dehydropantoate 2-reductase